VLVTQTNPVHKPQLINERNSDDWWSIIFVTGDTIVALRKPTSHTTERSFQVLRHVLVTRTRQLHFLIRNPDLALGLSRTPPIHRVQNVLVASDVLGVVLELRQLFLAPQTPFFVRHTPVNRCLHDDRFALEAARLKGFRLAVDIRRPVRGCYIDKIIVLHRMPL